MTQSQRFSGWRMTAVAFVAQSLSIGVFYGMFGSIQAALEHQYAMSRVQSVFGFSCLVTAFGIGNLLAGMALSTRPVRWAMVGGLLLQAAAFAVMSFAGNYGVYLACCVGIGAGMAVAGVITPLLLISRWFNSQRTFALGLANLPIVLGVVPLIAAWAVDHVGLGGFLRAAALAFVLGAACVAAAVIERPSVVGQEALGGDDGERSAAGGAAGGRRAFLADWRFWCLALCTGILNATGSAFLTHVVAYVVEKGVPLQQASTLASTFALAGILGTVACSWIADRISAVTMLAVVAFVATVSWVAIASTWNMPILLAASAVFGLVLNAVVAIQGAAVGELFPPDQIGSVSGMTYLVQLPLMFSLPLLVGMLKVQTGAYAMPFQVVIAVSAVGLLFMLSVVLFGRRPAHTAVVEPA